jgi:predicted GIY-YIG superfamily endonuclease
MPYKKVISGIYLISTPRGNKYIGSSNNIYRRWSEHRRNLRRGSHHSTRLQAAWNRHAGELRFEIICECSIDLLEKLEQKYISEMKASLNTTNYVGNVWCNPETREKLNAVHQSASWKKSRSEIATRVAAPRRVQVDCSNGKRYESFSAAAKEFGIRPSGIKFLVASQRQGKLGFRFKLASDEWRDVLSHYEQAWETRVKNGNNRHSDATKKKMSIAKAGYVPHNKGVPCSEETKAKISATKQLKARNERL